MFQWWIREPIMMAGSCPTNQALLFLYGKGFRVVISLLNESEQPPNYDRRAILTMGYSRYNIPVSEGRFPTMRQIGQFMEIIRRHADEKIFVHCLSGDQRAGAMAVSYWIAEGLSDQEARTKLFINRNRSLYMGRSKNIDMQWRIKTDYEDAGSQRNRKEMGCEHENWPNQGIDHPRYSIAGRQHALFRD